MIDTKLLRQKILDLAIQGKLVSQNPNDEPASVLLEKIRNEKAALVNTGKIKAPKHSSFIFRGEDNRHYENIDGKVTDITDQIPFKIPQGWEWCRLEILCKSICDGDHQPPPQAKDGIPFLVISNVSDGHLSFNNTRFVPVSYYNNLQEERIARCGDLLVTVTGSYGIPIIVDTEKRFCFQRHIALCRTLLNDNFILKSWFQTSSVKKQFDKNVTGTAQQTLSLGLLRETLLPIPPFSEQQRIVSCIEQLFALCDTLDKAETDLEATVSLARQKVLDLAIRGQLVPQNPNDESASELLKRIQAEKETLVKAGKRKADKRESTITRGGDNRYYENVNGKTIDITDQIPFEIPSSWEWVRLEEVLLSTTNKQPSGDFFDYIDIDSIDNTKQSIRQAKHIKTADAPSRAARGLKEGDVLFSLVRPYLRNIALVPARYANAIASTGFYVCRPCPHVSKEMLFLILTSNYVVQGITGFMRGDNSPSVRADEIEKFLIPLPPLPEQKRIVDSTKKYIELLDIL